MVTLATRLADLGGPSFTGDEAANLALAQGGVWQHLEELHSVPYPPLWYGLLGIWSSLFGNADVAVRLLSVVAGIAFVPVIAELARRMYGDREAVCAAFLAALWPLLAQEQREVRAYAWIALGTAVVLLAVLHAGERDRPRDWAVAGLALAALASIHHFGFLAAAGIVFASLAIWRRAGPLIAASVMAVAYVPTAYFDSFMNRAIIPFGTRELSLGEYLIVFDGVLVGRLHIDRSLIAMAGAAFLPALAIGIARSGRWRWYWVTAAVASIAVPIALTRISVDWLLGPDHFAPLVPLAILAVARFATSSPSLVVRPYSALLAAILVAALPQALFVEPYFGTDWRVLVADVEARTTTERAVYIAPGFHLAPLAHYYRGSLPLAEVPQVAGDPSRANPGDTTAADLAALVAGGVPEWLILDDSFRDRLPAAGWREVLHRSEGGIGLYRLWP